MLRGLVQGRAGDTDHAEASRGCAVVLQVVGLPRRDIAAMRVRRGDAEPSMARVGPDVFSRDRHRAPQCREVRLRGCLESRDGDLAHADTSCTLRNGDRFHVTC